MEWEKIFVSCSSDRGLIYKNIKKKQKELNTKRTSNPINKLANKLNNFQMKKYK
jgi:hypothetical protein